MHKSKFKIRASNEPFTVKYSSGSDLANFIFMCSVFLVRLKKFEFFWFNPSSSSKDNNN